MAKEHLIERYGQLRYTIGTGCSGGSLAQQWIANAYPGIYQGILPTCSFPDAWSTATQFLDYHLTARATSRTPRSGAPGVTWTPDCRWPTSRAVPTASERAGLRQRAVPRRRSRPIRAGAPPTSRPLRPDYATRAACAARSRTRRSTSSARGRCRSGRRRSSRSAAGSPHAGGQRRRAVRPAARCSRARSRRPSSSTSTQKVGGLDIDANHTPRPDARQPGRCSPTPTAAA